MEELDRAVDLLFETNLRVYSYGNAEEKRVLHTLKEDKPEKPDLGGSFGEE